MSIIPQQWFEMEDLRKRRLANSVWVPLRSAETIPKGGTYNKPGFCEELFFIGSVAFPPESRDAAEKLGWSDIGIGHSGGPYAFKNSYKPCEVYQYRDEEDLGIDLVFDQHIGSGHSSVWHVSQDIILALHLLQEGDSWVRPEEGYIQAIRQRRDAEGKVIAIEIRSDFLRDYLAARGLALRVAYYRRRMAILEDASHLTWPKDGIKEEKPHDRFSARVFKIDADGGLFGGGVAIFQVWRTDVDPDEDVPVFGPETDENTAGVSTTYQRAGRCFFRAEGELWREEWIEPAERSERVRGDEPSEQIYYVVDAAGTRKTARELDNEDIGQYLWFDPRVIMALSSRRGGGLDWYTSDTGSVWCSPDYPVHFGINKLGLVNVYAYDVASRPIWQQRIWAGHNVGPDGAVGGELLDAQMRTKPAKTLAPESELPKLMDLLDQKFETWICSPLFKKHGATVDILRTVHRFRAIDKDGLLALAKDVARILVDRIEIATLRKVISPPKGENWGSLKSLEKTLGTLVSAADARSMLTPLAGVYELRLGDAHLPSGEIEDAIKMVGIDPAANSIEQGRQLLNSVVGTLRAVLNLVPE